MLPRNEEASTTLAEPILNGRILLTHGPQKGPKVTGSNVLEPVSSA